MKKLSLRILLYLGILTLILGGNYFNYLKKWDDFLLKSRYFYITSLEQISIITNILYLNDLQESSSSSIYSRTNELPYSFMFFDEKDKLLYKSNYDVIDPKIIMNSFKKQNYRLLDTAEFTLEKEDREYLVFFKYKDIDHQNFKFFLVIETTSLKNELIKNNVLLSIFLIFLLLFLIYLFEKHIKNRKFQDTVINESKRQANIFDTIIQSKSYVPLIITDRSGFIHQFGNAAEELFDYKEDEMLWSNIRQLFAGTEATANLIGTQIVNKEVKMISKLKKEITAHISVISLDSFDIYKERFLYFINDVSEQERAKERLQQELNKTQFLSKYSEIISNIDDQNVVIEQILERLKQLLYYDYSTIFLLKDDSVLEPFFTNNLEDQNEIMNSKVIVGNEITGLVAKSKKGIFINNALTNPLTKSRITLKNPGQCIISIPLITKRKIIGILELSRINSEPFTDDDLHTLDLFSASTAGIIDNSLLFSQLTQAREQQEEILNETHVGLFMLVDSSDISFANDTLANFLEYDVDYLVGKKFQDFIVEEDRAILNSLMLDVMLNPEGTEKIRAIKKSGETITLEVYIAIINQGEKLSILGTVIDVSDKIRLAEELLNKRTKENIEIISASLIHDIKNILVGVAGPIDLIKQKFSTSKDLMDYTELIEKNLDYVIDLSKKYLSPSTETDVKEKYTFDINELLGDGVKQISEVIGENIVIENKICNGKLLIDGSKEKLYNSIINLLYNSRDAMPNGGVVTIKTSKIAAETLPLEFLDRSDSEFWAKLSVKDSGCGIPENIIKKIFISHFSTKQKKSGTGLGLAIVKDTIENGFSGYIEVKSKLDVGTEFIIYLPIVKIESSKKDQNLTSYKKCKVVLLDDEEHILQIAKEMLEVIGHQVVTFSDADQFIEMMSMDNLIDIAIIDKNIDKWSGDEVFSEIAPLNPNTKFVLATGYISASKAKEMKEIGFHSVITKPFRLDALSNLLQELTSD